MSKRTSQKRGAARERRNLIAHFLSGRNAATRRAYAADVADFARHIGVPDANAAAARLFGGSHGDANGLVLGYRSSMVDKGLAPNTINRRLTAVRSLVKLAQTLGIVPWSIAIRNVAVSQSRQKGIPRRVFMMMLGQLAGLHSPKAKRDAAILRLICDLGLWCCEVARLDIGDLDLDCERVLVRRPRRTGKEWMTVAAPTVAALRAWLEVRGENPNRAADERDPLFIAMDNRYRGKFHGLSTTGIYDAVRQLGDAVGVRVTPRLGRHQAIEEALRTDVRAAQAFAGHLSIQSTCMYAELRKDIAGHVARQIASRSPGCL